MAQLDLREVGGADAGKDYWVAYNATRRTLEKLEVRLRDLGLDPARDVGEGDLEALAAVGWAIRGLA